jgi:hypothetical protein
MVRTPDNVPLIRSVLVSLVLGLALFAVAAGRTLVGTPPGRE